MSQQCPKCGDPKQYASYHTDAYCLKGQVRNRDERIALYRPYYDAIKHRHNGYDADARKTMPNLNEPATPNIALGELIDEAAELARMESKDRIAELEAVVDMIANIETTEGLKKAVKVAEQAQKEQK